MRHKYRVKSRCLAEDTNSGVINRQTEIKVMGVDKII